MPVFNDTTPKALLGVLRQATFSHLFVLKSYLSTLLRHELSINNLCYLLDPPNPPIAYILPSAPNVTANSSLLVFKAHNFSQTPDFVLYFSNDLI
jgi:hypothetical protein